MKQGLLMFTLRAASLSGTGHSDSSAIKLSL
ncbi:bifunctional protein-disulfide isomerase/oxidoreductase DsbC, partial [Klebsiella pneumoniae]|nr:bifunctional protein-disulfide isomerase/oxidoreductase DsbC [Klebsiella pneumoniae]